MFPVWMVLQTELQGRTQGGVSQNLSSVTNDNFYYKLLKSLLLIGYQQICHWFCHLSLKKALGPTGLIKTRFKSVSQFFLIFPRLKKKKKKKIQIFFFFLPIFLFFPFYPDFPDFLYSSLFFPIFLFSYSKGGNVVRCHFPPAIPLFFLLKGGVVEGKTKNLFLGGSLSPLVPGLDNIC